MRLLVELSWWKEHLPGTRGRNGEFSPQHWVELIPAPRWKEDLKFKGHPMPIASSRHLGYIRSGFFFVILCVYVY